MLFNSDLDKLDLALKLAHRDYQDKAVRSIRSKVTNIQDHLSEPMTIIEFRNFLRNYFSEMNPGLEVRELSGDERSAIKKLADHKYRSWEWNFGAGATPGNLSGQGPHDVIYESFGPKVAALTVTSSRGCEVTKIVDLFVDPCCADTSTLDIDAFTIDESCPNINDGIIEAFGISL